MSYIIKNSTQGTIAARLTDAGRKKLSEGKLNIGLFQLGDSEMCYDCYSTSLASTQYVNGLNILQAEHNAQNLTPIPEQNKGHIKYPLPDTVTTGNTTTFGPTIPQHQHVEVFNTATPRGFFKVPTQTVAQANSGTYTYFSGETTGQYVLSSNWTACFSALTGGNTLNIFSGSCTGSPMPAYTPRIGDLISITYEYTSTYCSQLNYSAASQTLFYQVIGGNTNTAQTSTNVTLTLDRNLPNFYATPSALYSAQSSTCVHVNVYPPFSASPMVNSSIYTKSSSIQYWCDDTLSFNGCCNVSTDDVKIWNMNINWTHQVAGVDSTTVGVYEGVENYGSTGYCSSKEYFGYESNNGQTFSDQYIDSYHNGVQGGSWYYDSYYNTRVVLPEEQKCIGLIHYTNKTTTDFYGEKFAMKRNGYSPTSTIGEAKNFKLHLPWLMWHKKHVNGSGDGTGAGNEGLYGQTFYVNPPTNSIFNEDPHYMYSSPNSNMNDPGLRYYHLQDDNIGTGTQPNIVGKVYPDYKMLVIDDEELLAAMSYKSNRSYTLPAPKTEKIPAGTACLPTGQVNCQNGVAVAPGKLWISYLFVNNSGFTSGLHCNYYVYEEYDGVEPNFDVGVTLGSEFPYLRPFATTPPTSSPLPGTGWEADRLFILTQFVANGSASMNPSPQGWAYKDVTGHIPNHTYGDKITASNLIGHTFYLTGNDFPVGCGVSYTAQTGYTLNNFITVPEKTQPERLQFGDEYFLYGTLETDIMATIYEMRHVVQVGQNQYTNSVNPTWVDYTNSVAYTNPRITEIGLFDNENGFPDLMAIAKFQSPVERTGTQQFVITIDF
jgi:hypothetical protein|tara:strand:+ start:3850 stop:6327 length:2478 start_codon:yes stop_codon:yes gene_type:complete